MGDSAGLEQQELGGLLPQLLLDHTTCALGRLGQMLLRLSEHRLERIGLRTRHAGVLMALRLEGPLSQQALGNLLRIDPATMVSTINDLEMDGLVKRDRDAGDARRHAVTMTSRGAARLEDAERILDDLDNDILVVLTPRQQHILHEVVSRLAQAESIRRLVHQARPLQSVDR
jgi:DNA-binding MarR family transcriptional regulator